MASYTAAPFFTFQDGGMFIGRTRFDGTSLQLQLADGQLCQLTPAQAALLHMLMRERGRVVSRASLRAALSQVGCAEESLGAVLSSLELLLGGDWRGHIEEVSDQGLILHGNSKPGRLFGGPLGDVSMPLFIALVLMFILLLLWLSRQLQGQDLLPFNQVQTLSNASGQAFQWRQVGEISESISQMQMLLTECRAQPWDRVSVSAWEKPSGSWLNLVFEGGKLREPHNLKLFDMPSDPLVTKTVLQEAGLCD